MRCAVRIVEAERVCAGTGGGSESGERAFRRMASAIKSSSLLRLAITERSVRMV